ncbi:hypothetical protein DPMN_058636 [Dreissena polymorpha]|uniref:Glycylpeptide N-tetradecanoyltransferase n=1 Tax=Dreissena polymorpha TaxID=45954 RepID=A0A9D4C2F7_DREPO|nr:hypothetical protein DPMN_058636 [Dreissena polymorpha]
MQNKQFLDKLKFGIGDGNLQYYLYNWRCTQMEPYQVGKSSRVLETLGLMHVCKLLYLTSYKNDLFDWLRAVTCPWCIFHTP